MSSRAAALALVLAAAALDAAGAHGLAFYALVASVPAAAAAGLSALNRIIEHEGDEIVLLQALLWGLMLVLLVLGCASRSHALDLSGVPPFAHSTLIAVLAVVCVKAVLATGARLTGRTALYSSSTSAS